jgi:hypothetical protein
MLITVLVAFHLLLVCTSASGAPNEMRITEALTLLDAIFIRMSTNGSPLFALAYILLVFGASPVSISSTRFPGRLGMFILILNGDRWSGFELYGNILFINGIPRKASY